MKSTLLTALAVAVGIAGGLAYVHWRDGRTGDAHAGHNHATHSGHNHAHGEPCGDGEFCHRHQIAEADCPWCNKSLIAARGQCREHNVPEALCWKCNPALVAGFKAEKDWCAEHACPESLCTLCNPGAGHDAPTTAEAHDDHDHAGHAHADNPVEGSRLKRPPNPHCRTDQERVQLASTEVMRRAGLLLARVEWQPLTHTITANAEVTYNAARFARISPRASGIVRDVLKNLGDRVQKGDVLVQLESPDVTDAMADHLQALAGLNLWEKSYERKEALSRSGLSAERDLIEAQTRLLEQRSAVTRTAQRLRALGVTPPTSAPADAADRPSPLLELTSPLDGVIVERSAVAGETAAVGTPLLAVADTSTMWVLLDIFESDVPRVELGQPVTIELDGLPGAPIDGRIDWISTQIDPKTRTLKARVVVPNADGRLRANMFGRARIVVEECEAMVIPKSAVQWDGCCNVVFVRQSATIYQPTKVLLGHEENDRVEVKSGLEPGQFVVTQGSFLLKTELMKGEIGAGCCGIEAK